VQKQEENQKKGNLIFSALHEVMYKGKLTVTADEVSRSRPIPMVIGIKSCRVYNTVISTAATCLLAVRQACYSLRSWSPLRSGTGGMNFIRAWLRNLGTCIVMLVCS